MPRACRCSRGGSRSRSLLAQSARPSLTFSPQVYQACVARGLRTAAGRRTAETPEGEGDMAMRFPFCGRVRLIALLCMALLALESVGAGGAAAATLTVCPSGCTFSQIAPAIAAASPGDTIQVAPGTYNGGFIIDKNLSLIGAGARATSIKGGGPIITIG